MSKVSKEHQIYNHELYYHTKEVISPIYLNLKKKKIWFKLHENCILKIDNQMKLSALTVKDLLNHNSQL